MGMDVGAPQEYGPLTPKTDGTSMTKALCLLHANCQGDALRPLLENTPAFASRFNIRQYVNYTRQSIADSDIERCELFLYQRLAPKWGDLSTEQMLPRLPQHCLSIEIPNLFFKGYWPFWSRDDRINFADSLLETLLQKVTPQEALTLYLRGAASLLGDADALNAQAEESLAREEAKEADAPIRCAPLLRERWRDEQMFITVNHPGRELLFHMVINGRPGLACHTQTSDLPSHITLHPLPVFKLLGDLSVDTGTWFRNVGAKIESCRKLYRLAQTAERAQHPEYVVRQRHRTGLLQFYAPCRFL